MCVWQGWAGTKSTQIKMWNLWQLVCRTNKRRWDKQPCQCSVGVVALRWWDELRFYQHRSIFSPVFYFFFFPTPRLSRCASIWQSLAHLVMLFTASLLHAVALINKKCELPSLFFLLSFFTFSHLFSTFTVLIPILSILPQNKEFGFGLAFQEVILNVFLRWLIL